jgi:hypothetical protein
MTWKLEPQLHLFLAGVYLSSLTYISPVRGEQLLLTNSGYKQPTTSKSCVSELCA